MFHAERVTPVPSHPIIPLSSRPVSPSSQELTPGGTGSVPGKKRGDSRNEKKTVKRTFDSSNGSTHDSSTRGYMSMASLASTSSVGVSSETSQTAVEDEVNASSDVSNSHHKSRDARSIAALTGLVSSKPPPGRPLGGGASRRTHPPLVEPPLSSGSRGKGAVKGGSAHILGTRSKRKTGERDSGET